MPKYQEGDIVWVAYEKSWWPAIVSIHKYGETLTHKLGC